MTYTILSSFVDRFEHKLETFSKKFEKFGEGSLTYKKHDERYDADRKSFVIDIDVEGKYEVKGYQFVASLENIGDNNVIKKIDADEQVPEIFRTRCECDHCKTNRFRKNTVLLKKDDQFIQVGKQCVVDYLGCNIENYASYLSMWKSLDEFVESNSTERFGYSTGYEVEDILGQAIAYSHKNGYISATTAFEDGIPSTSDMVKDALNANREFEYLTLSEKEKSEIKDVIEFVKNCEESGDYIHNLKALISTTAVRYNNIGLVVSAVGYYLRKINDKKSEKTISNYIAEVGEKVEFKATPKCVYSCDSQFGTVHIYKFDVNGNDVVWTTNKYLEEVEMTIRGTVKACETYKGRKQTVITRCKATNLA